VRHPLIPVLLAAFPCLILAADAARKAPPWEKPNQVSRNLYLENCSVCHELVKPKSAKIGPTLIRFKKAPPAASESLRKYVMYKIRAGGIKMPAFGKTLNEDQIRRIADYLLP